MHIARTPAASSVFFTVWLRGVTEFSLSVDCAFTADPNSSPFPGDFANTLSSCGGEPPTPTLERDGLRSALPIPTSNNLRRRLIPSLEHVTCRVAVVTPT